MKVILGKNKEVTISPWKAITKKNFLNVLRDKKENIGEDDILNTLVLPYLDDEGKELYLSIAEVQWILKNLREISVGEELSFILECDACEKEFDVETTLDNITHYTPNQYPVDDDIFSWVDLATRDSLKIAMKKYKKEPPKLIEMLLHLEKVDNEDIKNLNQALEYYNNLTLPEEKRLTDSFRNVESYYSVSEEYTCPHCGETKKYTFDVVPGFFDPLMPADI
jgi:hypothetical protein